MDHVQYGLTYLHFTVPTLFARTHFSDLGNFTAPLWGIPSTASWPFGFPGNAAVIPHDKSSGAWQGGVFVRRQVLVGVGPV